MTKKKRKIEFRCSEAEYLEIKRLGGDNVSKWILGRLLLFKKDGTRFDDGTGAIAYPLRVDCAPERIVSEADLDALIAEDRAEEIPKEVCDLSGGSFSPESTIEPEAGKEESDPIVVSHVEQSIKMEDVCVKDYEEGIKRLVIKATERLMEKGEPCVACGNPIAKMYVRSKGPVWLCVNHRPF